MIPIFRLKFLLLFFGSFSIFGQQTSIYTHELKEFDNAISLYKDMQFQSAQILFEKVKSNVTNQEVQADCAYYIANCAVRLNQQMPI